MNFTKFVPALGLLFSISAAAYPDIGDKVQWQGSIHLASGETTPVKITKEVTSYNKDSKKWTVKYTATVGTNVTTEFVEVDELYSPAKHKEMITSCASHGGSIEKIEALGASYETCKLRSSSAGITVDKWYGDIPFGVVSRNTMDTAETPDLNAIARGL